MRFKNGGKGANATFWRLAFPVGLPLISFAAGEECRNVVGRKAKNPLLVVAIDNGAAPLTLLSLELVR
jgi:hypothetical protein